MNKVFTYHEVVDSIYYPDSEDYEEETITINYKVNEDQLLDAVVDLIFEDYFRNTSLTDNRYTVRQGIRRFIEDRNELKKLVEEYEDRLKIYFEDDAMKDY